MIAEKCLEWCHEVRHHFPNDQRTAHHCLEWLAARAYEATRTPDDVDAVNEAIRNAAALLNRSNYHA